MRILYLKYLIYSLLIHSVLGMGMKVFLNQKDLKSNLDSKFLNIKSHQNIVFDIVYKRTPAKPIAVSADQSNLNMESSTNTHSFQILASELKKISQSDGFKFTPSPQYPIEALEQRQEGELLLKVKTDGRGYIAFVSLEKSSGYEILDTEVLKTVKEWRLSPDSSFLIPFRFKITDQD